MVVRISSGSSPSGAVYYNENKVGKGEADRLSLRNYEGAVYSSQTASVSLITRQLEERADLNQRISKPTFHVSLSLAQGEKPSQDQMLSIADRYMEGMGYGQQPYAVYQHHDTDHAHIHIVSVRVDENGKKIPDQFERERSNKLRQWIELEFGLQVAEKAALRPARAELNPVTYGQGNLKGEISAVVQGVLKDYTFSTFSQFNQLLGLYNVKATEINVEGKKPGLVYGAMDHNKVAQGAPYKSSSLPFQPTMDTVNRRINAGKKVKADRVGGVRKVAHEQLSQSHNWDDFQQRLSKLGIETMPHLGKDGNLFGVSFIDTRGRAIYTGSELGKSFTAGSLKATLGEQYAPPTKREVVEPVEQQSRTQTPKQPRHDSAPHQGKAPSAEPIHNQEMVRHLLNAIGDMSTTDENEHELKQMLKRARRPSRS